MQDDNRLCYVCSPYRGNIERNVAYARELTRLVLDSGYVPVTPHLYLPQVLDEDDPEQRNLGLSAGLSLLKQCKYILIGSRYGLTEGMMGEIKVALLNEKLLELAVVKDQGLVVVHGEP